MKVMQTITGCAAMLAIASATAVAQQPMKGSVADVDEADGAIYIYPASSSGTVGVNGSIATDKYKVRDSLLFNAAHPGDRVSFSVETIDGVKTITQLSKER